MAEKFIVKVQMPITSNIPDPPVLVYNEDRSICEAFNEYDSESLAKHMSGETKKFFYAHIGGEDELILDKEAPWQDW